MHIIITTMLALAPAHAADDTGVADCDEFGFIAESDTILEDIRAGGEPITLNVRDATTCAGTDPCEWRIEGGVGDFGVGVIAPCNDSASRSSESAVGNCVNYLPAASLKDVDCRDIPVGIYVSCPGVDYGDNFDEDGVTGTLIDVSPECTVNASVTGGGCISAQGSGVATAAWLLFPLIGIGGIARRRQD